LYFWYQFRISKRDCLCVYLLILFYRIYTMAIGGRLRTIKKIAKQHIELINDKANRHLSLYPMCLSVVIFSMVSPLLALIYLILYAIYYIYIFNTKSSHMFALLKLCHTYISYKCMILCMSLGYGIHYIALLMLIKNLISLLVFILLFICNIFNFYF
jgi:hypothetical protein